MSKSSMYIDVPGEGYGRSSYPFFMDEKKQVLSVPNAVMVLVVKSTLTAKLESFFNGVLTDSRAVEAGDNSFALSQLVKLAVGEASFRLTQDDGSEVLESGVYVFTDNYTRAYQANSDKVYKLRQAREERQRLAAACPAPAFPETYQDLIDKQLVLAGQCCTNSAEKLRTAADVADQAATAQAADGTTDGASRAIQEAARLLELAKMHRKYAQYYKEEQEAAR